MVMEKNGSLDKQSSGGNDKVTAAMSYMGVLIAVPFLIEKKSGFVKFHMGQGLTLFVLEIAYSIAYKLLAAAVMMVSWRLYVIVRVAGYAAFLFPALAVIGIVNVVNGQEKELPVIGKISGFICK